jgi:RNA polymerase sigma-70 factor (ECF subfamily)
MDVPDEVTAAIDAVARGNRDAFRRIVRAYSLPLRAYLANLVHHLSDVDDLAQEVFLAAYRGLATYQRGSDFGAWLRGIARHKAYKYLRRRAARGRVMDGFREELARTLEADIERAAAGCAPSAIESLLHCIERLPEKFKRVVRAGLDGDKPADVAEALATTVGAVYNLHYRANKLLRDCMTKELA